MSVIVVFVNEAVFMLTGASSGIGRGTAIHLSTLGCRLVLAGRDAAALQVLISYSMFIVSSQDLGSHKTVCYHIYYIGWSKKNGTTFNKS